MVRHRRKEDNVSTRAVIIIGCVKQKISVRAKAKDLYTSDLFKKRRAYAEASGKPWAIALQVPGV